MTGSHDPTGFISDVAVFFGSALAAAVLLRLLRAPSVVGFLAAGILIGPSGLNAVQPDAVESLAEVGLVLLLFVVGLELSPRGVLQEGMRLALVAALQVGLTTLAVGVLLAFGAGLARNAAFVTGVAVTFSSTAIVLKLLADRRETDSPAGRVLVATLLLQDLAVVVFMIALPLLAGSSQTAGSVGGVLRAAGLLAASAMLAWLVLPRLVVLVARQGGRELVALFSVVLAAGGAWLASAVGWSPALGAFLAGLLLAESDERHRLAAEILPFRDVFNALFFVATGMMLDVAAVARAPWQIAGLTAAVLAVKGAVAYAAARLVGWPWRVAALAAFGLASLSEFTVLVAREARRLGVIESHFCDQLIAVAVGSMVLGALAFAAANSVIWLFASRLLPAATSANAERPLPAGPAAPALNAHVIIIGYGLNGENLARVLAATRIPYCVVEMNRALAQRARDAGCAFTLLGDAARSAILEEAAIARARALVIAINDRDATRRIVAQAAALRPDLYILARTRFVSEIDVLYRLGARTVIPEEFETSIEIFTHVLHEFGVADNVIHAQVKLVRAGRYRMMRGLPTDAAARADILRMLEATATQTFLLEPGCPIVGRTIRDADLRARTGVTILAVVRHGVATTSPPPEMVLQEGDVLVLMGPHAGLDQVRAILAPPHYAT